MMSNPYAIKRKLTKRYAVSAREQAAGIIAETAQKHGVTVAIILSHDRTWLVRDARHEAIARVFDQFPHWSYPVIGKVFDRDHTTIMHALRRRRRLPPRNSFPNPHQQQAAE